MAATAAMAVISIGSAVYQNQVSQKQKGIAGKAQRDADALQQPALASAPDVTTQQADAQRQSMLAGGQARKKALAAFGRSDTILTGPRGITDTPPAQRKTLLGL